MSITMRSTKSDMFARIAELEALLEERDSIIDGLRREVEVLKDSYDDIERQLICAEEKIEFLESRVEKCNATIEDLHVEIEYLKEPKAVASDSPTPVAAAAPPAPVEAPRPSRPLAAPPSEDAPTIGISDEDRDLWSKFTKLSRDKRLAIIGWARPRFGFVGIWNIKAVRDAWHEFRNPTNCADESVLTDIA